MYLEEFSIRKLLSRLGLLPPTNHLDCVARGSGLCHNLNQVAKMCLGGIKGNGMYLLSIVSSLLRWAHGKAVTRQKGKL
jgi:hypothetical protein